MSRKQGAGDVLGAPTKMGGRTVEDAGPYGCVGKGAVCKSGRGDPSPTRMGKGKYLPFFFIVAQTIVKLTVE